MVYADLGKIQQVLYNLIDNAIKFSHSDSTIFIQTTLPGLKRYMSPSKDTGIGIPKDSIKKIWERFIRQTCLVEKIKKGTGLGLSIVKKSSRTMARSIDVIEYSPGSDRIHLLCQGKSGNVQ